MQEQQNTDQKVVVHHKTSILQKIVHILLILVLVYIIITSIFECVYSGRVVYTFILDKNKLPEKITLPGDLGFIALTNSPYEHSVAHQVHIYNNVQHIHEMLPDVIRNFIAQLKNIGPLQFIFYTGYMFPLRQAFSIPKYIYYYGPYKLIAINRGHYVQFSVIY